MTRAWLGIAVAMAACSCGNPSGPCVGPPGLYVDDECEVLSLDLIAYEPAFPLWADGADKERYVRLPPGTTIDASLPDDWVFPVGTTFYKTFSLDGVRLETRVLRKISEGSGVGAWEMRAYAWDAEQRNVRDVTRDVNCPDCAALRTDVLGTEHDIPSGSMCRQCHSGARDVVNGFSAVQLASGSRGVTLEQLQSAGQIVIDNAVARAVAAPGDGVERAALGYLHGNCAHCHRRADVELCGSEDCCRTPACISGLYLGLHADDLRPEDTDVYETALGRSAIFDGTLATCRISGGHPDASVLALRMASRGSPAAMPRIATEHVDEAGLELVREWIRQLPNAPETCPH